MCDSPLNKYVWISFFGFDLPVSALIHAATMVTAVSLTSMFSL